MSFSAPLRGDRPPDGAAPFADILQPLSRAIQERLEALLTADPAVEALRAQVTNDALPGRIRSELARTVRSAERSRRMALLGQLCTGLKGALREAGLKADLKPLERRPRKRPSSIDSGSADQALADGVDAEVGE